MIIKGNIQSKIQEILRILFKDIFRLTFAYLRYSFIWLRIYQNLYNTGQFDIFLKIYADICETYKTYFMGFLYQLFYDIFISVWVHIKQITIMSLA